MGKTEETKTVTREKTTTTYYCDDCGEAETEWLDDLNTVALNPEIKPALTPGTDKLRKDGVVLLCDGCYTNFTDELNERFGLENIVLERQSRGI